MICIRIEINKDTPIGEALVNMGLSFEEFVINLNKIKTNNSFDSELINELTLKDAAKSFLDVYKSKSPNTFSTYKDIIEKFIVYMDVRWDEQGVEKKIASKVKRTDIELFLASRNSKSPHTYNKWLDVLSSFFKKYLVEDQGLLYRPPTDGIRRKKVGHPGIKFLTRNEQEKVLRQALKNRENGERDFVIIFLALNTGLRLDEIHLLNIGDIDIRQDRIYVYHGKGDKYREVFLNPQIKEILIAYLKNSRVGPFLKKPDAPLFLNLKGPNCMHRLSYYALEQMVVRTFRKCGISKGATHRLRHSFAVNALESGFNIVEIMQLLGHESISTTICKR